jgi:dTMP kinase
MKRGKLIALEGIDGAGTTTHTRLLREHLSARGLEVHTTNEPSRGPIGRLLRSALHGDEPLNEQSLALLFAADRLDHVVSEVEPHLSGGRVVITDRYVMSSLAYQSLTLPMAWVAEINGFAPKADVTLFLRVSPQVADQRVEARGGPRELYEKLEKQVAIAKAYEAALERGELGRVHVVDAEQSVSEVAQAIARIVDAVVEG